MSTASYQTTLRFSGAGTTLQETVTKTGTGVVNIVGETVTASSTGTISFALDVTACQSFFMTSDQDLLIETNGTGTAAADTVTLVGNQPYVWFAGDYNDFLLTTDVTAVYATNATENDATLDIRALVDATP